MEFEYNQNNSNEALLKWIVKDFGNIKQPIRSTEQGVSISFQKLDWHIYLFPFGFDMKQGQDDISIFIAVSPDTPHNTWCDLIFRVMIINQQNKKRNKVQVSAIVFGRKGNGFQQDCGFRFFTHHKPKDVRDKNGGYLFGPNMADLELNVILKVRKPPIYNNNKLESESNAESVESKNVRNYVGLENLGTTCYLNSLLQALFHLSYFRQAIYLMPTEDGREEEDTPLALQRLFYNMQVSEHPVSTRDLTSSFGWSAEENHQQQDIQELLMILNAGLDEKMKGSPVAGTIDNIFQGESVNIFKCVNVDYESRMKETFLDLSINVKGSTDIYNSFETYVEEEIMDGANIYHTDKFGKQVAKKHCKFARFPSVLLVHLKRFEIVEQGNRYYQNKLNDKLVFSPILHLDDFLLEPSKDADENTFQLHGVLVHRGSINQGHYVAYLRPSNDNDWYEFDDHKVRKVPEQEAIENNYGSDEFGGVSSAYMLVYIKKKEIEKMLKPLTLNDLPPQLLERFQSVTYHSRERARNEEILKAEYEKRHILNISYCTEKDIKDQCGNDLVDKLRIEIAKELDLPPQQIRLWTWGTRRNDTHRPVNCCTDSDYTKRLCDSDKLSSYFIEVGEKVEKGYWFPDCYGKLLLFFKFYNTREGTLRYLGYRFYDSDTTVSTVINDWSKTIEIKDTKSIVAWEEISMMRQTELPHNTTLHRQKLLIGDIIVFQEQVDSKQCKFPKLSDFFVDFSQTVKLTFRLLDNENTPDFELVLNTLMTYTQLTTKVAEHLKLASPFFLRFKQPVVQNGAIKRPHEEFIRAAGRSKEITLGEIISITESGSINIRAKVLFYEINDVDVRQIENLEEYRVYIRDKHCKRVSDKIYSLYLKDSSTPNNIFDELKRKKLIDKKSDHRVMRVFQEQIVSEYGSNEKIKNMRNYLYCVEPIGPDDKIEGQSIRCVFFRPSPMGSFYDFYGEPFIFIFKKDEKLSDAVKRIQAKLALGKSEVSGARYCKVRKSEAIKLSSDEVVADLLFTSNFHQYFFGIRLKDRSNQLVIKM